MENQTLHEAPQSKSIAVTYILMTLVLIIGTDVGIYYWQHSKVNNLQSQLKAAYNSNAKTQKPAQQTGEDTFTYSPKTGGLTLVLPNKYGGC